MTDLRIVVTGVFIILCIGLGFKIALFRMTLNDFRVVEQSHVNGVRKMIAHAAIRRVRAWMLVFIILLVQLTPRVFFGVQSPVVLVFLTFLFLIGVMFSEMYAEYKYRYLVREFILERLK